MDADALNLRLENMGAQIESSIGTVSGQVFMSSLTETADEALALFADVIMHPAFPRRQDRPGENAGKISSSPAATIRPMSIVNREFAKLLYGADSPYARHTEYATVDALERQDLIDFHQHYFLPNNTILGVWGDFDTHEAMAEKLEKRLRRLGSRRRISCVPTQPIARYGFRVSGSTMRPRRM